MRRTVKYCSFLRQLCNIVYSATDFHHKEKVLPRELPGTQVKCFDMICGNPN